jgi:hypothetical protein
VQVFKRLSLKRRKNQCAELHLPELETRLDRLDQGEMLGISNRDFERLFGMNDVAAAGLLHFGHDCVISRGENAIYFRKRIAESHKSQMKGGEFAWLFRGCSRGWGTDRRPGRKQRGILPGKDIFGAPKPLRGAFRVRARPAICFS